MKYLLQISIGPIQEFIASARRTSDLWYGSKILSDISKEVAKSIQGDGKDLIFPNKEQIKDDNENTANISNIILAEIEIPQGKQTQAEKMVQEIYKDAENAGEKKWKELANLKFLEDAIKQNIRDNIDMELFNTQIKDAIEFYAAAVPISNDDYQEARKKLVRIFAGRKALRNFEQSKGKNIPKSSLDGRRESVLKKDFNIQGIIKSKELKNSEQLCAIGLIKRINGLEQRYPSVARITADYWIRQVKDSSEFIKFKETCENLGLKKIRKSSQSNYYDDFPFDGSFLFEDRYPQLKEEGYIDDDKEKELKKCLNAFKEKSFKKKYGTIYPYFAIIQADGDKMGAFISSIQKKEDHKDFSRILADFSKEVKGIVEKYHGVCVYAGGDDVLAFLPLDCALDCARELRNEFFKEEKNTKKPTLSVGISIGHFMEPLEDLRDYANRAEKLAKNNDDEDETKRKNGLAITINPRNGGNFHIREQWKTKDNELSLDNKIKKFAQLFIDKKLPTKLPYDLRTLATSLKYRQITGKNEKTEADKEMNQNIIQQEIKILLKRKQQNTESIKEVIRPRIEAIKTLEDLFDFAEEMLVSQWFAMGKQVKEGE